jgi:hypothetical protein
MSRERQSKKRSRNDAGDGFEADMASASALTSTSSSRKAAVTDSKSVKKVLPAERLLPQEPNALLWSVVVQTPETFSNMISFLRMHDEITLFPTDRRRAVKDAAGNDVVDKDGKVVTTGFRGFAVDAMDPAKCLMTVARLTDRVSMNPLTASEEHLDALPSTSARPEYSVTVETKTLQTMCRDVKAHESFVIYSTIEGSDMSIATSDSSSESLNQNIRTRMSPTDHQTIGMLEYKYELSVPLDRMKTFIRRATELHATEVTLSLRSLTPSMWVFIVCAEGEDGDMCRCLPIPHVTEVRCGERTHAAQTVGDADADADADADTDADAAVAAASRKQYEEDRQKRISAQAVVSTNNADMIGAMHAPNHAFLCASDSVVLNSDIPVRTKELENLSLLYTGKFSTKYLSDMVKPLSGDTQLTLFVGASEGDDADAPLVMRFDLGKPDSYVAYVLAPKIPE